MRVKNHFLFLILCLALLAKSASVIAQQPDYLNYIELKSFVTNFGPNTGPMRFMKAEVTLQLAENGSHSDVSKHIPQIRNDLVFLFNEQQESDLATIEAQAILAQRALIVVQSLLIEETGRPQVNDLFFTSLVIQ
ncbi:flagellar basal body-associated FliL family protein [Nitrincola alkalilacustris]|uniref:flagellar basal body-associated FliL family protein n=1 Tax=Nitrincola alkalilacustris TaxID=1571224 RepID=UPI00124DCDC3|nr:flagellar basal body-associated FliL family protein [Nitrincola alkalilacustris]